MELWLRLCVVWLLHALSDETQIAPETDVTIVTATEGNVAILPCHLEGFGISHAVWVDADGVPLTVGNMQFTDDTRVSVERPSESEWNLLIRDVRHSDQGEYRCLSGSRRSDGQFKRVMLNVQDQTVIPQETDLINVTATENSEAILPCHLENVGNQHVVWLDSTSTLLTLDDRRLINDPRVRVERPSESEWNLHIRNVHHSDQREYRCLSGSQGFEGQSKRVMLNVQERPTVTPQMDTTVEVTESTTAVLPCRLNLPGHYSVFWINPDATLLTYNEMRIYDDSRISVQRPAADEWNLQILDVRSTDQGEYACRTTSPITNRTVNLQVIEINP